MSKANKNKALIGLFVTVFLAAFTAILFVPVNTAKADTYYYANEPAEISLGLANVFGYSSSGYVMFDNTQETTLSELSSISWYFGGTMGQCKMESHDWNIKDNYAFMLDFTETWEGIFFLEYGHYDIQIDKENDKIVFGMGGGNSPVNVETPGLSELTGMHKVNFITRVIYSDIGKQTPVGVRSEVTIGDDISCAYDRITTQHISCTVAHTYRFVNATGKSLRINANVPLTYYYEEDPVEIALKDLAPQIYSWDDTTGNNLHDFSYAQTISNKTFFFRDSNGNILTNPASWYGRSYNVAFQIDFSDDWGNVTVWDRVESGHICLTFGYADVSVHKDTNEVVIGFGGKYAIKSTCKMNGLSDLTGMQKVNIIQKLIYADEDKTIPVGMHYTVKVGSLTCDYDWESFPYTQTAQMRLIAAFDASVLFSGLSGVAKDEYTVTYITDENVEPIAPITVKAGSKIQEPTLSYINEDAVFLGFYMNDTDTIFNFEAPISMDHIIDVRFADEIGIQETEDFTAFTYKEAWDSADYLKEGDVLPSMSVYRLCKGNTEVYATESNFPYNPSYSVGSIGFKVDLGNEAYEQNEAFGWTRTSVYFRVLPYSGEVKIYTSFWNVTGAAEAGTLLPAATIDLGTTNLKGEHSFVFTAEWLYIEERIVGRRLTVCFDGAVFEPVVILDTETANFRTIFNNNTSKGIVIKTIEPELMLDKIQSLYVSETYTESTWSIIEEKINDMYSALKEASSPQERRSIYDGFVAMINGYPDKIKEAVVVENRETAYANLAAQYVETDYYAENWGKIQAGLSEAQTEYAKCLKISEVETVTNKYIVKLGGIATKEAVLIAARANAITEIENSVAGKNYTPENAAIVREILSAYNGLINAESNTEYIKTLKDSALKELTEVSSISVETVVPVDSSTESSSGKKGCKGDIGASFGFAVLILLGGIKKYLSKKEN